MRWNKVSAMSKQMAVELLSNTEVPTFSWKLSDSVAPDTFPCKHRVKCDNNTRRWKHKNISGWKWGAIHVEHADKDVNLERQWVLRVFGDENRNTVLSAAGSLRDVPPPACSTQPPPLQNSCLKTVHVLRFRKDKADARHAKHASSHFKYKFWNQIFGWLLFSNGNSLMTRNTNINITQKTEWHAHMHFGKYYYL